MLAIRAAVAGGDLQRAVAARFGTSQGYVSALVAGKHRVRCGYVGDPETQREYEFEPIDVPAPPVTVPEPAPAEPEREPVPA